ncbi:unnamed protein product [Cyberlindnera jadinii]|uniref:Uncharacterized protein n=1 Tax=Cyberlindnera jadinii (strain ATCC 18201 / CBS 1600 / BCRC 20928 / JCM 3617 / NBRC 0987 / NRRL Y-1542) TaxID=983966 RepID=A0A1E4RVF5_CYBJN|nr:hypothetical protein CYBJADRAFT_169481 [Cyberlindnera jadinii NRRL Y-1542]XP_020071142.1 hypothetical protein CYBJADRAFT_167487 [Cyberlindnera jadinii NRRL Y-1542]ODV71254.1 hypothetical protein CYBJADRAFT_169481 [Cyberlindnera jadinii NRRL Y-1542]ODV74103.1 hypothetical protein CYBJADRAFT_167487 [Cyberlindnera jadinii NRRL Y-1542]CEP24903.1 unnamed protein product [Cyberlindnera jadinii]
MTIAQASVVPITNSKGLETITLKNIVSLDLIEQNEAVLKAAQLLDDSATRVVFRDRVTTEKLKELIETKQMEEQREKESLVQLKHQLSKSSTVDKDTELINKLSTEFLSDSTPIDDVDDVLQAFEKENGVKVILK